MKNLLDALILGIVAIIKPAPVRQVLVRRDRIAKPGIVTDIDQELCAG